MFLKTIPILVLAIFGTCISQTCHHKDCLHLAKVITDGLDESIDPCEDFEKYICKHVYNPSVKQHTSVSKLRTITDEIHERLIKPPLRTDIRSLSVEKQLYRTCYGRHEKKYENILQFLLTLQAMDGLSVLSPTAVPEFQKSWQEADKQYAKMGIGYSFFDLKIRTDPVNLKNNIIFIVPPASRTTLHDSMRKLQNMDFTTDFANALNEVIREHSTTTNRRVRLQSKIDFEDIAAFASELQDIISSNVCEKKVPQHRITVRQWQKEYGGQNDTNLTQNVQIDWLGHLRAVFENTSIDILESENIYIHGQQYFDRLFNLLEKTPDNVITSYVHLHFISEVNDFLNLIDDDADSQKSLCLFTSGDLVGAYQAYVQKPELRLNRQVAKDIQTRIENHLLKEALANWRDRPSKEFLLYALENLHRIIGYPDWMEDLSYVENYYNDLEVSKNYFQNVMNVIGFIARRRLELLRDPNLPMYVSSNVLFGDEHEIVFEAPNIVYSVEHLRVPKYNLLSSNFPQSVNLGSFGFEVGLLTYSLLNSFGGGMLAKNRDCFEKQINCSRTSNQGFESSLEYMIISNVVQVMVDVLKMQKDDTNIKIQGLEQFSDSQLFFMSFGNNMCSPGLQKARPRFPFNKILSNIEEFSTAFNCPKNSTMNRNHKCVSRSSMK